MNGLRWLFLRSAHKGEVERTGPPPSSDISDNDDMWTHFFAEILHQQPNSKGLIARIGDDYKIKYNDALTEQRLSDLVNLESWQPDVVIDRGGYKEYSRLKRHKSLKNSTLIYFGCGERYNPSKWGWMSKFDYKIIFVDSPAQQAEVQATNPRAIVEVFHKPALENIFYPRQCEKQFDMCFNCHREIWWKGGGWLAKRMPSNCKILRIGPKDQWFANERDKGRLDVTFTGKISRCEVPAWACQAKIGIVCDNGEKDSGPRILPEFLAMNIPIIVRDTVNADLDLYVRPETGIVIRSDGGRTPFYNAYNQIMNNYEAYNPRRYYEKHFTLAHAAKHIIRVVEEARKK